MKPGGPERISYPVPFSDTRREVHIPKASRGKSNLNINQTCLQDVSRQCVSKNFYSLCLVFCVVLCGSLFAFYPLWCQSLFFFIVVPVFVFYPLWCQSLCFIYCGVSLCVLASLSSNCEFWLPLSFVCKWETFIFYCIFHTKLFKILFWRQFMSTFSDLYLSTNAEKYVFCSSNSQIIFRSIFFIYSWFEHRFKSFCQQNLYHCIVFCA